MTRTEPERGRIQYDIDLGIGGVDSSQEIIERIQLVSDRVLWNWKTFPLILPPSLVDGGHGITLKDLFILPTFDELETLATDSKGRPRFLTHNQLESIKRKGQFSVDSLNFPGQNHVFKISPLIQKGISNSREDYLDGLALSLRFLALHLPSLVIGDGFSLKSSLTCLKEELIELIDLIIGVGKVHSPNLEGRIHEERCKYLVAELKCKGDGARGVGRYVRSQAKKALREKVSLAVEKPPPIPYKFTTPINIDVDLRLFDKEVFRRVYPLLQRILERASRGWFLGAREKVISELKTTRGRETEKELEMEANRMIMDEYLSHVFNGIRKCVDLQSLDIDLALIEQAQLYVLMNRAVDAVAYKLEKELLNVKKCLIRDYTILSRDEEWMQSQMERAKVHFSRVNRWLPHEIALELCKQHYLKQHCYFLARDLTFGRDREVILRKELEGDQSPRRIYEWKTRIWFQSNYVISHEGERIRTVLSSTPTPITSPSNDPYRAHFTLERTFTRNSSSRWPLWRISNIYHRSLSWILNIMYLLGYIIPWNSPISLRALFTPEKFYTDVELSQVNGTLRPSKASEVETLWSRLKTIRDSVERGRAEFEGAPNTDFLGRGLARWWNVTWNYAFKGALPSLALLILFPIISIMICSCSLALAATSPLWVPPTVLIFHLISILVFDIDAPMQDRRKYAPILITSASLLLQGILQPVLCLLGALLVCPFIAISILIWTVLNYGGRLLWDTVMFYSLIKPKGRLPSSNSWIVKRISGPGLDPDFYFEIISIEQALIAFQAKLELEELNIYYQQTKKMINQPIVEFKTFFGACFEPFSGKCVENSGPLKDLIRQTQGLRESLDEKFLKRRNELEVGLNVSTRGRIRMGKSSLEKTLISARRMAHDFYPERVFSRIGSTEKVKGFWETKSLEVNDWGNLTSLLITEIFCPDFLTPLEDSDVSFPLDSTLKGCPIPTEYFLEDISRESWNGVPLTKSKVKYQIHSPYLEVNAFNPAAHCNPLSVKENMWHYLSIPLPILHPAFISVIIYNRETESGICLDNPVSRAILGALESSGPMLNQSCISLDSVSSSSSNGGSDGRSPQGAITPITREEILLMETPSPLFPLPLPIPAPGSSISPSSAESGGSPLQKLPPLSKRLNLSLNVNSPREDLLKNKKKGASKVSLASPEEDDGLEVVLSTFGTSV